jgi:hypothetical protein
MRSRMFDAQCRIEQDLQLLAATGSGASYQTSRYTAPSLKTCLITSCGGGNAHRASSFARLIEGLRLCFDGAQEIEVMQARMAQPGQMR